MNTNMNLSCIFYCKCEYEYYLWGIFTNISKYSLFSTLCPCQWKFLNFCFLIKRSIQQYMKKITPQSKNPLTVTFLPIIIWLIIFLAWCSKAGPWVAKVSVCGLWPIHCSTKYYLALCISITSESPMQTGRPKS